MTYESKANKCNTEGNLAQTGLRELCAMNKKGQLTLIIILLGVIAWLIDQIRVEVRRVVLVEKGEATEARETGNRSASAADNIRITPKVANAS